MAQLSWVSFQGFFGQTTALNQKFYYWTVISFIFTTLLSSGVLPGMSVFGSRLFIPERTGSIQVQSVPRIFPLGDQAAYRPPLVDFHIRIRRHWIWLKLIRVWSRQYPHRSLVAMGRGSPKTGSGKDFPGIKK